MTRVPAVLAVQDKHKQQHGASQPTVYSSVLLYADIYILCITRNNANVMMAFEFMSCVSSLVHCSSLCAQHAPASG